MRFTIILALFMGLACPASAQADTIVSASFGGAEVRLVIPKGYCAIDRTDPLGAIHYKMQDEGNKGKNAVGLLFADCAEWAKRQADNSYLLKHHGSYLFQLTNGQELLLPITATRDDLIKIYVDYELKKAELPIGARDQDLMKILKEKLATSSINGPTLNSPINYGMIDKNTQAVFLGGGMNLQYPEDVVRVNFVTAATLVRRVSLSINLYGPNVVQKPFSDLLVQQKSLVKNLVAANE